MPIYAFQCEQCHDTFDVRATIRERQEGLDPECPHCHAHESQQVITSGVMLHGAGGDSRRAALAPAAGCGWGAGPGCCG